METGPHCLTVNPLLSSPPLPLSNKPSPFKGKKVNKPPLSIKRPVSNKPSPFKGKKVNKPPLSIKRPPLK